MRLNQASDQQRSGFLILLFCLVGILAVLFHKSFEPNQVHFANDGPIGALMPHQLDIIRAIKSHWETRNWLGSEAVPAQPTLEVAFLALTGRVLFSKFMAPFSALMLGISAWLFFRQLRFHKTVCVLGGIAAALNANTFSNACWGQYSRPLTLATTFLALAALVSAQNNRRWLKTILAGFAVGWGIFHGFDVGALYSLCVAGFAVFLALNEPGPIGRKAGNGALRVAIVAACAAFIATHVLVTLISTQIKGVVTMQQSPQERWDMMTQWSTPKIETLRVMIPGLMGYRMDSPGGAEYWGRVGQAAGVPTSRFNGSGEYAGMLVVLVAALAVAQSFRKKTTILPDSDRNAIWFWSGLAFVSLLLAWGRYAPFYKLFYSLPYASTIRNPMKFMHLFHMALLVLFGYGLQLIWRLYLEPRVTAAPSLKAQIGKWWKAASPFDRLWTASVGMALVLSILGFLVYIASRKDLENYIQKAGFDPGMAVITAAFSIREVGIFILFFGLSAALLVAVFSGWFSGSRAGWAGVLMGLLLFADLGRANTYWIKYWNYKYKYESNPVIEILANKPYEHRVAMLPFRIPQIDELRQFHGIEWHQQHFPFYGIQSIEFVQNPRAGSDDAAFMKEFGSGDPQKLLREWELTNTRFIIGLNGQVIDMLNQQLDPAKQRFKLHTAFDLIVKPGVQRVTDYDDLTVTLNPNGKYALLEFTGALPRAKLYSNWQVITNDALITTNGTTLVTNSLTLDRLGKPDFDPQQIVLISGDTPAPAPSAQNQNAGEVEITSYAAKRVELKADAKTPSVLLLNDKFNPHWKVTVDGQPATLLRCNFLMRGVHLQPGNHTVVFQYDPPATALYVTAAGFGVALICCGLLLLGCRKEKESTNGSDTSAASATPAS